MGTAAADSRRDDALGSIEDWMANRWRDVRRLGSEAEAAGHEALGWAARTGAHIFAPRPGDVAAVGDQYRRAQDAGAVPLSLTEVEPPQEIEKVEPGAGPDYGAPQPMDLGMQFQAARAGDNISRMIGSSDPRAIGKFLSLNGMNGRDSTLRAGRSYIVPTRWDDASDGEAKAGQALLGTDNARLQALAERRAEVARPKPLFPADPMPADAVGPLYGPRLTRPATARTRAGDNRTWLDDSPTAKAIGGTVAYGAGLTPGAIRGGYHTVGGALRGAYFVSRLTNPADFLLSPPGESAQEQLLTTGQKFGEYVDQGLRNPARVRNDIAGAVHRFRLEEDPTVIPMGNTLGDELRAGFKLGMNHGELGVDVGSLLVGGEALRGAAGLGAAAKAADATELARLAENPGLAARFAEPYIGMGRKVMGHHILARSATLPDWLGGGPYPKWFIEGPFNKIQEEGITTRDFYRNHNGAAGHFWGSRIPAEYGGGSWSAKDLGWEEYGPLDKLNYGTSPATKAVVGPVLFGGPVVNGIAGEPRR